MPFDDDFCFFILIFFFPLFLGKRKWEKNNQSRGQKSCHSSRSIWSFFYLFGIKVASVKKLFKQGIIKQDPFFLHSSRVVENNIVPPSMRINLWYYQIINFPKMLVFASTLEQASKKHYKIKVNNQCKKWSKEIKNNKYCFK